MRVLVCDQESEMLETVTRWYDVDTATSKATCVDLMRANPFDLVIASERLSDGSGLELLSHVASRWPDTLRVLVIEPERLRLLRGKLAPFRLHATMRYPIEEEELDRVLNRMYELMSEPLAEQVPPPEPEPPPPTLTTQARKVQIPQQPANNSSSRSRPPPATETARASSTGQSAGQAPRTGSAAGSTAGQVARPGSAGAVTGPAGRSAPAPATRSTPSRQTSQSARAAPPLGAPLPPTPPPVRRKLGNYTPLGSPEDDQLRIVERGFDQTAAPLAARAIRSREEATRPRTQKEKLGTLATHLRDTLKKLLKR